MFSLRALPSPSARPIRSGQPASVPRPPGTRPSEARPAEVLGPEPVVELTGAGRSTFVMARCLEVLARHERAAWLTADPAFYPVAVAEAAEGLVGRLLTVRLPDGKAVLRAADLLLSTAGAVAAVALDLGGAARPTDAQLWRLSRLAERSGTTLWVLGGPGAEGTFGTVASVRLQVRREAAPDGARVLVSEVVRRKSAAAERWARRMLDGPDRLRLHRTL